MNCPKCGAKVAADRPCITIFQCGSESDKYPSAFYETRQCVRNQLATVTAERDELLKACLESLVVMTMNGSTLVDPTRAIRMASEAIEKARSV